MRTSLAILMSGLLACEPAPPSSPPPVALEPAVGQEVSHPPPPLPPPPPQPRDYLSPVPEGMVDLCEVVEGLRCQIAYHSVDNFTGAPLPGYGAPAAWMLSQPAEALVQVHRSLAERGYGLLVFDAYRPIRGTLAMVAWAERTGQAHLLNGYIARRSGHNHGHTVDLTLYQLDTGEPVDMGCPFDTLDERAHTSNAEGEALAARLVLVQAMKDQGFHNYSKEWWHYRLPMDGTQARDVPYGCFEAAEGAWEPVEGWDRTGYEPAMSWDPRPCPAPDAAPDPGSVP